MLFKHCPHCSTPDPLRYVLTGPHEGVLVEYVVDVAAPVEVCECRRCGCTMPVVAWQRDYTAGRISDEPATTREAA